MPLYGDLRMFWHKMNGDLRMILYFMNGEMRYNVFKEGEINMLKPFKRKIYP